MLCDAVSCNNKIIDYTKKEMPLRFDGSGAFAALLVVIFLCVGFVNISSHEMWRDELQVWMTAKASTSVGDLLHNKRNIRENPLKIDCLSIKVVLVRWLL